MFENVKPMVAVAIGLALGPSLVSADAASASLAKPSQPARWALTTSTWANSVSVYAIAGDSGALTPRSSVFAAAPGSIAVHPSGRFAYVAVGGTRSVQAFRFNADTGTLVAGASVPVTGNPYEVAVEPLGRFLYVSSVGSNTLSGFWIHPLTGALSPLPGFPLATGAVPHAIVFDRLGLHAFVSNWGAGTISAYRIGLTGRLTPAPGSPINTLPRPEGLSMHPSGRFLYAAHGDGGSLSAFRVDFRGTLTPLSGSPFPMGLDPFGVATSVDGRTLYVSEPLFEVVLMRRIDPATGAVSDLPPGRVPAGNNVRAIRVEPSGRFLYVAAAEPTALFAYAIDGSGVLTPVAGSPFTAEAGLSGLALVR